MKFGAIFLVKNNYGIFIILLVPISYLKNKGLFHIDLLSNIILDMYGRMGSSK